MPDMANAIDRIRTMSITCTCSKFVPPENLIFRIQFKGFKGGLNREILK